MILNIGVQDLTYSASLPADLRDGSRQTPDESASSSSAVHLSFLLRRFSDKVKHIKILTKDGCFYIAESRLFKTVLVKVLASGRFFLINSTDL